MEGLRTGTCPKCGKSEVYTTRGIGKRGERMVLSTGGGWDRIFLDTYICTECGYFEEVVPKEELTEKIVNNIKKKLKKVYKNN